MDIKRNTYENLSAKQRAIAAHAAVGRNDQEEVERLMGNAPRGEKHGQTIIALSQAMDAYNSFTAKAIQDYLVISGRLQGALSFCSGWLGAGGAIDAAEYRESASLIEQLTPLTEKLASEVESIQQAAREWCGKNQIPTDFFSGALCHFPLSKETKTQSDDEALKSARSVFDLITLVW